MGGWGGGGAVNAYLIKNSKTKREREGGKVWGRGRRGGGGGALSQTVGRIGRSSMAVIKWVSNDQSLQWQSLENLSLSFSLQSSIMSQPIICNYFKVCTKLTLEGAE